MPSYQRVSKAEAARWLAINEYGTQNAEDAGVLAEFEALEIK